MKQFFGLHEKRGIPLEAAGGPGLMPFCLLLFDWGDFVLVKKKSSKLFEGRRVIFLAFMDR